jgi:hypothetical protein
MKFSPSCHCFIDDDSAIVEFSEWHFKPEQSMFSTARAIDTPMLIECTITRRQQLAELV